MLYNVFIMVDRNQKIKKKKCLPYIFVALVFYYLIFFEGFFKLMFFEMDSV